jgi:murein DD-endopeptidase MepM/ murein hydrolase activator NlpD
MSLSARHAAPAAQRPLRRTRRTRLAVGSILATCVFAAVPALPASADVVEKVGYSYSAQSLVVDSTIDTDFTRDSFTTMEYTEVQAPVPMSTTISSGFGYRVPPCAGCSSYHKGIDLLAGAGNPIEAIADGTVSAVGNPSGSLGVYVVIDHVINGNKVSSTYAHMALGSMHYSVGDQVTKGDVVGKVGSTGTSTGPHLYFEIRLGGVTPVEPYSWLVKNITKD